MREDLEFPKVVLDTINEHIGVIDDHGGIAYVNRSWNALGRASSCLTDGSWNNVNYLEGGEEFALVFGNTALDDALAIAESLDKDIQALDIPNVKLPTMLIRTVSMGLAAMKPSDVNGTEALLKSADDLLYAAKRTGRNQIAFERPDE